MRVLSIEPTPSPQTLRCQLDITVADGLRFEYTIANKLEAPDWIQPLFTIDGVRSVFHAADFIAIDKKSEVEWDGIVIQFRGLSLFGASADTLSVSEDGAQAIIMDEQEVHIWVQIFAGLPIQWKFVIGLREQRVAAPDEYRQLVMKLSRQGGNVVEERKWVELEHRYGNVESIAEELILECPAAYGAIYDQSLQLISEVMNPVNIRQQVSVQEAAVQATDSDWKVRYQLLSLLQRQPLDETYFPVIIPLLNDKFMAVRRLAGVVLNTIQEFDVVPALIDALHDESAIVRRTIGDSLTDRGDLRAQQAMESLLVDASRMVRWRAARFLYEFGTEQCLEPLKEASDDAAFEVRMQIKMAIDRIELGVAAAGSIWQQMGGGHT